MVYSRWWRNWRFGGPTEDFSVVELVNSGTIDFKLAGLLWILMEHRASVLVAAGPSFAGKSTLLHTLLDFLPPRISQVHLQGYDEDFSFLNRTKPEESYMVIEELSNHGYGYVWGQQAIKTFELLPRGYALGGTIHARTAEEVVYILRKGLGLPLRLISKLGVIITIRVSYGRSYDEEPDRRVDTVSVISTAGDGLTIRALALRRSNKEFDYAQTETLQKALFDKLSIKYDPISLEVEKRERFLSQLHDNGIDSKEDVRKAISKYYKL